MHLPDRQFNVAEMRDVIFSNINSKRAPGFDRATCKILNKLPNNGYRIFGYIYSAVISTGYLPSSWEVANIVM